MLMAMALPIDNVMALLHNTVTHTPRVAIATQRTRFKLIQIIYLLNNDIIY